MTQNSDPGDAAGDAGPTTDSDALWAPKVKIGLIDCRRHWGRIAQQLYWRRRVDWRGVRFGKRRINLLVPGARRRSHALGRPAGKRQHRGSAERGRFGRRGRFRHPDGGGGLGIGTVVVLGIVGWALGIDPSLLIGGAEILSGTGQPQTQAPPTRAAPVKPQDEWAASSTACSAARRALAANFRSGGRHLSPPVLVLYRGRP